MFGFVQWDSPLALLLEVLLSAVIVVGLIMVVRRVNAQAEAARQERTTKDQHPEKPNGPDESSVA